MSQLIAAASFLLSTVLAAPITHPLPSPYTPGTHLTLTPPSEVSGDISAGRVFATRDEASSGISAGAIGGIIVGVIVGIPLIVFLIARISRSAATKQTGFNRPLTALKAPYPQPHPYAAQIHPPPPAYPHPVSFHQQQQQYFPPLASGGPVQMPQTVHMGSGGSFYAPSAQQCAQEEERGVRFGPVGVRQYRQ